MEGDNVLLEQISKKLSILIALQIQAGGKEKEVKANVEKLAKFGLSDGEIAQILGSTPGTVSVAKARIKKSKAKSKGGK